jgi:hypothetical protein
MNLVPQSPIDEAREYVRKYLKDQLSELVSRKLVACEQFLTLPFLSKDLTPTSEICNIGRKLEGRCLPFTAIDFVDNAFIFPAIGSLSATLSDALDRTKKTHLHLSNSV